MAAKSPSIAKVLASLAGIRGTPYPISQLCLPEWPWVRQSAVFSGILIAEGLFEKRCGAVCFVNIETGRLVSFVNFEDGRAIKQGAIHLESLIPKRGLEPAPSCEDRILSPVRLPSTWRWKQVGLTVKLLVWQTVSSPLFRH